MSKTAKRKNRPDNLAKIEPDLAIEVHGSCTYVYLKGQRLGEGVRKVAFVTDTTNTAPDKNVYSRLELVIDIADFNFE